MVGIGWARGINNNWVVVILIVLGKRYRMLAPHSKNIAKAAAGSDLPSGNNLATHQIFSYEENLDSASRLVGLADWGSG